MARPAGVEPATPGLEAPWFMGPHVAHTPEILCRSISTDLGVGLEREFHALRLRTRTARETETPTRRPCVCCHRLIAFLEVLPLEGDRVRCWPQFRAVVQPVNTIGPTNAGNAIGQ